LALIVISYFSFLLILGYVTIILFFIRGWRQLKDYHDEKNLPKTKVSVLIAARNEEKGIHYTIEDILAQNYPKELMEVIIVDDHSTDGTADIISSYSGKGVKLIKLNEGAPLNSYKKKAITEAINISDAELIVATDADCRMGKEWLKTIVSLYEKNNLKLISSPVIYFEEKNLFEEFQTLEFLALMGLGAASIGNKMPSTCNGANLAYRKDVFFELQGFRGIDDLASGDDELFLHKVALHYPNDIAFCKSTDAIVYTHAKHSLKEFRDQRKRWASKSTHYKNKKIIALGVFIWLSNVSIFLNAILGFYDPYFWQISALCLSLKFLAELSFLLPITRFIKRPKLLWLLPLVTVIHIFYLIYIGIAGNSGKYHWKGRMVR
jgi:cellulose synthase/poly-beta-1,6-N-acetylglucosamine synthase-like glycosyltransferase